MAPLYTISHNAHLTHTYLCVRILCYKKLESSIVSGFCTLLSWILGLSVGRDLSNFDTMAMPIKTSVRTLWLRQNLVDLPKYIFKQHPHNHFISSILGANVMSMINYIRNRKYRFYWIPWADVIRCLGLFFLLRSVEIECIMEYVWSVWSTPRRHQGCYELWFGVVYKYILNVNLNRILTLLAICKPIECNVNVTGNLKDCQCGFGFDFECITFEEHLDTLFFWFISLLYFLLCLFHPIL